jgi:hypothetical protein
MTDQDPIAGRSPTPDPPAPSTAGGAGSAHSDPTADLERWMVGHADGYTPEALDAAAMAAGWTPDDVRNARKRAHARIRAAEPIEPIKSTARRAVVVAYLAVWVLFGVAFFASPTDTLDFDFVLFAVLTVALGIASAMSFSIIRVARPDAERRGRALVLLLAIPVVLLLGVAGLCLPTIRVAG